MNIIEIKKRSKKNKILNLDDLIKINFKTSLYENIDLDDDIKIFIIIKNISTEQINLLFELIDKFIDYMYIEYRININEYIILYNQHQNEYRIIFQNTNCNLFDNMIYVNNFTVTYSDICEKHMDIKIYSPTINIICPLQFEKNNKGKYKRRSKNYNYYKIIFYKKHNQIMFYGISHDYIKKYYSEDKLFELTFQEMHNHDTVYKSLIANNYN